MTAEVGASQFLTLWSDCQISSGKIYSSGWFSTKFTNVIASWTRVWFAIYTVSTTFTRVLFPFCRSKIVASTSRSTGFLRSLIPMIVNSGIPAPQKKTLFATETSHDNHCRTCHDNDTKNESTHEWNQIHWTSLYFFAVLFLCERTKNRE